MKTKAVIFFYICSIFLISFAQASSVSGEAKVLEYLGARSDVIVSAFSDDLLKVSIGSKTVFASSDGAYIFAGPVINTQTGQDIVELEARTFRKDRLASMPKDMFLSFSSKAKKNHEVTIFTDIDCSYCRRFHSMMDQYNEKGISIRYAMMPRAGKNSQSYNKTVSMLCSKSPQMSMNLAMKGQFLETQTCENTLDQQMALAREFSITATPTMILPSGEVKAGFLTPEQLVEVLK